MNNQEVIYKGRSFTVMWYIGENGKSQPRDYFFDCSEKEQMTTTYGWFISDSKRKAMFDEEYKKLSISEFVLEQMEIQKLSVRKLAEKANVAPNTVLKLRKSEIGTVDHRTLQSIMSALGYAMTITFERQPGMV